VNVVMGTPAKYDLLIDQGSTLRFQATWVSPGGSPIDLTGFKILFQIRREPNSATTLMTFTSAALTTGQQIAALGPTGVIDVTIADEQTALLPAEVCVWDLVAEGPTGIRDKLLYGRAIVRPSVTR
jgi:hypothetical protein